MSHGPRDAIYSIRRRVRSARHRNDSMPAASQAGEPDRSTGMISTSGGRQSALHRRVFLTEAENSHLRERGQWSVNPRLTKHSCGKSLKFLCGLGLRLPAVVVRWTGFETSTSDEGLGLVPTSMAHIQTARPHGGCLCSEFAGRKLVTCVGMHLVTVADGGRISLWTERCWGMTRVRPRGCITR